jgi:hypothetical protein
MQTMTSEHSGTAAHRTSTTVRTPHVDALAAALNARDHAFSVIAPDVIEVPDVAPDDLGWLAAAAGVVVYEMVTRREG